MSKRLCALLLLLSGAAAKVPDGLTNEVVVRGGGSSVAGVGVLRRQSGRLGGLTCSPLSLTESKLAALREIKKSFSEEEFCNAGLTAQGLQQPLVGFWTSEFLFYAWEIREDKLDEVRALLPAGFELAPIVVAKGEKRAYQIVLNIYNVLIFGNPSIRAEWSTFVATPADPEPRFMILDAPTNVPSVDPSMVGTFPNGTCNLITPPSTAEYVVAAETEGQLVARARFEATGGFFESALHLPTRQSEVDSSDFLSDEWNAASEKNYWLNGVYDKAYYNGKLVSAPTYVFEHPDESVMTVADGSYWGTLVKSDGGRGLPRLAWYFIDPVDFAVSNWENLLELPPPILPEGQWNCLNDFKVEGFLGLQLLRANQVAEGLSEALLPVRFVPTPVYPCTSPPPVLAYPTIYANFEIKKRKKFERKFLPDGFKLAKMEMVKELGRGQRGRRKKKSYLLTLQLIVDGPQSSVASWIAYVTTCDGGGRTYMMVVDIASKGEIRYSPTLHNPPATVFDVDTSGSGAKGRISAEIFNAEGGGKWLQMSLPAPVAGENTPSPRVTREWELAHDRLYYRDGVYDNKMCQSLSFDIGLHKLDEEESHIYVGGDVAKYVKSSKPLDVLAATKYSDCVAQPWFNLEEAVVEP